MEVVVNVVVVVEWWAGTCGIAAPICFAVLSGWRSSSRSTTNSAGWSMLVYRPMSRPKGSRTTAKLARPGRSSRASKTAHAP